MATAVHGGLARATPRECSGESRSLRPTGTVAATDPDSAFRSAVPFRRVFESWPLLVIVAMDDEHHMRAARDFY